MACLVPQLVLLYIAVCFCSLQTQDNSVIPPTFLNVSVNRILQQLLLEWDVNDEAYNSGKQMIFNIQINQTGANNVVWTKNYTTALNKSNRPIRWRWIAEEPMECMSYAVRIRSLVINKSVPVSESWSDWTKWKEVKGLDIEDDKSYVFPDDKVVEEGSDISFCCIGKKGETISALFFGDNHTYSARTSRRRVVFTVKNVTHSSPGGTGVFCNGSSTLWTGIFVTRPPGEPKNLSCETEDMVTLNCTWQPGSIDNLVGKRAVKFILSDRSTGEIYDRQQPSKNSSTFKIRAQTRYEIRLTVENYLGNNHTDLSFDVAHRIHPAPPFDLSVSAKNATAIELHWKMKHRLELLCQIESRHPDGKVDLHNSTSYKSSHVVSGLQPYTEYTFRVHCGASPHFWKWSGWSESRTCRTKESAPSGHLDVWRSISPGLDSCNITVFWKPFSSFHANGKIKTYEIFWEMSGKNPMPKEVPASDSSTMFFLDNCSGNISVLAKNSVNSSPPSGIAISEASENDHTWEINTNPSKEDAVNNTETGIYISWKRQSQFDGYVVDWCNHPRVQPCDFQWKKFGQNESSALITSDAFIPGVQYSFRVYGSHGNTASLLEKKAKYLKELEPASVPELRVDTVNSKLLTLTWDYDHLNESHPGFIRGYSVFVKDKHGNCTLEGSEKLVVQDSLVICKYTIEEPAKKTFTVKDPGQNKEYWLEVLAFSTFPPNVTDNINKGTEQHIKYVKTPSDESWIFQLILLLVAISVMLLICICFWRSTCVRTCCCPKIPHPSVTPIKVLRMYPKTLLAPSDLTPNNVIVEEHKLQPCGCKEKHYSYSQDLHAEMPAVETFVFQNITYFTDVSNCYQSLSTQEAEGQKPELALDSYKPLQCFTFQSNPASLNYVSQMDMFFPGVTQGDRAGPVNSAKQSDYRSLESESSFPDTSEETIDVL